VFGGARRDEDKARAKERIISLRDEFGQWDPRNQRPELWNAVQRAAHPGQHIRAFPSQLDRAGHLALHRARADRAARCTAHEREVFPATACGARWASPRPPARARRSCVAPSLPHGRRHELHRRGRVGCRDVASIVREVATTTITERGATRADDRLSEAAMEDRKKDGYF
jgi:sulfate adenylyltransferase subunit 2